MDKYNSIKLKYLYFALGVGVVFIHAFNLEIYGITGDNGGVEKILWLIENYCNDTLTGICVPFFFFISGYLFFRNYDWDKIWIKYSSRLNTLLVPYIIWNTVYFIAYFTLTHVPFIALHMNMSPLNGSLPEYLWNLWDPIDSPLWFVKDLMLFVLLSPLFFLIFKIRKSRSGQLLSGISIFFLIGFALFYEMGILPLQLPFRCLNVYFLGGGVYLFMEKLLWRIKKRIKLDLAFYVQVYV